MTPDTAGLVISASSLLYPAILERIPATEWRTLIRAAIDTGRIFVGAGRPDQRDGTGIYALVHDIEALPSAIAMAHRRVGEITTHGTMWLVYAEGDVERVARETLAQIMPTEGCA